MNPKARTYCMILALAALCCVAAAFLYGRGAFGGGTASRLDASESEPSLAPDRRDETAACALIVEGKRERKPYFMQF